MTTDTKAVARFEFTPYGMTEALDGGYIRLHDHERVVREFSAERLRWFERAGEYLKRAQAAEAALSASRAEVEGLIEVSKVYLHGEYQDLESEYSSEYRARRYKEGQELAKAIDAAMEKGNDPAKA